MKAAISLVRCRFYTRSETTRLQYQYSTNPSRKLLVSRRFNLSFELPAMYLTIFHSLL